jgi:hypothetical protein
MPALISQREFHCRTSRLIHIKGRPQKIRYNEAGADHAPVIRLMTQ